MKRFCGAVQRYQFRTGTVVAVVAVVTVVAVVSVVAVVTVVFLNIVPRGCLWQWRLEIVHKNHT